MASRNDASFVSSIPQPSKNASPSKGLREMSASATNARAQTMGPPAKDPPRKTLSERAGEPINQKRNNAHPNGMSLNGISRNTSYSSHGSSRPHSSASSRIASNSSYTSSFSASTRQPSSSSYRPNSALGSSRFHRSTQGRPISSLEPHREDVPPGQVLGKRKGMLPISSNHNACSEMLMPPRLRSHGPPKLETPQGARTAMSIREISISAAMGTLSLHDSVPTATPQKEPNTAQIPISSIPKAVLSPNRSVQSSPSKSPRKKKSQPVFLSKDTNSSTAWDIEQRLEEIESMQKTFTDGVEEKMREREGLQEKLKRHKVAVTELEDARDSLMSKNKQIQIELDESRQRATSLSEALQEQKRQEKNNIDDVEWRYRREIEELRHEEEKESRRLLRQHEESLDDIERDYRKRLAEEQERHQHEIQTLNKEGTQTQELTQKELEKQRLAFSTIEEDLQRCRADVAREKDLNEGLRDQVATATTRENGLEKSVQRLEGHIQFLESDNKSQSQAFADLEARMQKAIHESEEAKEKLIVEETLRRKLHNQVQELKGNIRVFCRVRPSLQADASEAAAAINYPDGVLDAKELEVMGPEEKSSLGNITTRKHAFNFDHVFGPASQNEDIFGEISQLVQSALDGYNVCIFCYGQTGSGKTFTMSTADGMIPRAVNQIYTTAKSLEDKGWKYSMSGSFIEVYNENLNDLLGRAEEFDKKKHEIRHDTQKCKTEVTGIRTVDLDSPGKVEEILRNANRNRTVAATQANERSSRSHSVFILKLAGENSVTGERSEGTLNLVDLAGSERLSHSGATGDRLKETQNINKSLSCLGDVIGALGQGKDGGHIPYRNSKLTYLLQFSLGGNSKTLMFVMISPQQAHLSETLTSLKFATKVHNTHIGTARKQTRTKE